MKESTPLNLQPEEAAGQLRDMPAVLAEWYDVHARTLPWRENPPNPYHVWVSEIMLQQTRIEAVKKYYKRFIETLPTISSLAACPEQQLLKIWEGLGYYNRVRNLQKTAQLLTEHNNGCLPTEYEALLKLPGFGPYTAGAVASICFDRQVSAVDGNVLRVFARLTNDPSDVLDGKTRKKMTRLAEQLISAGGVSAGVFNQALMELGETVCTAGAAPSCEVCPIRSLCQAEKQGTQGELPVRIKKTGRRIEQKTILVICDDTRVYIRRRDDGGLLAGMYELPWIAGTADPEEVSSWLQQHQLKAEQIEPLPPARHLFTHVEWQMTGYRIRTKALPHTSGFPVHLSGELHKGEEEYRAVTPGQLQESYPLPGAFAAYASAIDVRVGAERWRSIEN